MLWMCLCSRLVHERLKYTYLFLWRRNEVRNEFLNIFFLLTGECYSEEYNCGYTHNNNKKLTGNILWTCKSIDVFPLSSRLYNIPRPTVHRGVVVHCVQNKVGKLHTAQIITPPTISLPSWRLMVACSYKCQRIIAYKWLQVCVCRVFYALPMCS